MKVFFGWFIWGIGLGVSLFIIKIGRHFIGSFGNTMVFGIIFIILGIGLLAATAAVGVRKLIKLFKETT